MKLDTIELIGQLADLKEIDYKNTLAIAALIELFIAKGLITRNEFALKARELDLSTEAEITVLRRCR